MQKTCANGWCKKSFEVTAEDLEYYDKISPTFSGKKFSFPPPKFCPDCRRQKMLAWRNERTLYQRNCDLCKKSTVTVHSPENPYPVLCNPCWWSEKWDPLGCGKDFDPNRPFFEQYEELLKTVPQRALVNDDGVTSENCAFCHDVAFAKNCYLCFGMWKMQDCYYCRICDQSRLSVDCEGVKLGSEYSYECLDSQRIYRCVHLQNSEGCRDCIIGFDLKGCADCIACFGLRQKRYHIFNKPYSKEEFQKRASEMNFHTRTGFQKLRLQFDEWAKQFPRKNMNLQNCENCKGDHLFHCQNVLGYVSTNSQHSKWVERSDGPVWSYDVIQSGMPQWCHACVTVDDGYTNHCCIYTNQTRFGMFCDNCIGSEYLCGCISVRRRKYCILNKQYTKEEYERIVALILEQLQREGTVAEFFPQELSPFGYNETNAAEAYPLDEQEVRHRGWKWRTALPYTVGKETIPIGTLPETIAEVKDSIIQDTLGCCACKKNYRIVQQEFDFYKNMNIPLPEYCPDCRNQRRLSRRNPQKLWQSACAKCATIVDTTSPPERGENVLCEQCYLQSVY